MFVPGNESSRVRKFHESTPQSHDHEVTVVTRTKQNAVIVSEERQQTCFILHILPPSIVLHLLTWSLPYLRGGQALTPAQRWGRISSAQCVSLNVITRLQVTAIKP